MSKDGLVIHHGKLEELRTIATQCAVTGAELASEFGSLVMDGHIPKKALEILYARYNLTEEGKL